MQPPKNVLVVEDDADLSEVMLLLLRDAGYEARGARNGREALAAVEEHMPDVILLDMLMPVMNGWEFAREFRARHGHSVHIVVVTAAEHIQMRAASVDADAALPKPFDVAELLRVVEQHASAA